HHPRRGEGAHLRVRRSVLQSRPLALLLGVLVPGGVRAYAQPEAPLTSTPFSLGKINRRLASGVQVPLTRVDERNPRSSGSSNSLRIFLSSHDRGGLCP